MTTEEQAQALKAAHEALLQIAVVGKDARALADIQNVIAQVHNELKKENTNGTIISGGERDASGTSG